jgi:hypothetical protein
MKPFSILLVAASLFAVSCERHDFEGPNGTKQLNEHHGAATHKKHGDASGHHDEKKQAH